VSGEENAQDPIEVEEGKMMNKHWWDRVVVGLLVVIGVLTGAGVPSYAMTRGAGGFRGGGFHGGGFHGGGFHGGFHNRPFVGHHGFAHRAFFHHGFFGPRFFFGVGIAAPFWYPYPYPYPVYAQPAVLESAPPVYLQQGFQGQPAYWYYCQGAQTYYPYVKECPGGWLEVAPQPGPSTP
jgi:hypothetical protein